MVGASDRATVKGPSGLDYVSYCDLALTGLVGPEGFEPPTKGL